MGKKKKGGKKCFALMMLLAGLMICGLAIADDTSRGVYTTPFDPLTNWLNTNEDFKHMHNYDQYEPGPQLGLGLDLKIYENPCWYIDAVRIDQRWDINNNQYQMYGVVAIDVFKMVKDFVRK